VRRRAVVAVTVAAAVAAAGCGSSKNGSDTAAVQDTAAVSSPVDSTPATIPTMPNGPATAAVAPVGKQPSTSSTTAKRPATDTAKKGTPEPDVRAPLPTSAAPGVRIPPGTGTPAFIVFRDSLTAADLDWVRSEGMEIVSSDKSARSVSVMVPDGYHGKPRSNPRVQRFTIAMR
jgi:hypothetical protein